MESEILEKETCLQGYSRCRHGNKYPKQYRERLETVTHSPRITGRYAAGVNLTRRGISLLLEQAQFQPLRTILHRRIHSGICFRIPYHDHGSM